LHAGFAKHYQDVAKQVEVQKVANHPDPKVLMVRKHIFGWESIKPRCELLLDLSWPQQFDQLQLCFAIEIHCKHKEYQHK